MLTANLFCAAVIALGIGGGNSPETSRACQYMEHIVEEARRNNIRPAIMIALIHHESRFDPNAHSHAGACGLTQILPRYTGSSKTRVPRLTCSDLYDPHTSITMGARTLSFWYRTYGRNRNLRVALCGYNAGYRCKLPRNAAEGQRLTRAGRSGMSYARNVMRTASRIERRAQILSRQPARK